MQSFERNGRMQVCYDGELFRRVLTMAAASSEERAHAVLGLTRPDCIDPALGPVLAQPYIDMPGFLRAGLFYYQPQTDPDVIAYDNANLANTMPRKQFLDLLGVHADITQRGPGGMTTSTRTQEITVPVLVQAGMQDLAIAPASTVDNPPTEAGFFPNSPSVTVQKLDGIGHGFNGHYTHAESWDGIDAWLQATFP